MYGKGNYKMAAIKGINIKLEGVKEFTSILTQLPQKVSDSVLRSFNRKAATQYVVKPLRAVLPYSNITKKNIKTQASKLSKNAIVAGPTTDAWYVRYAEYGTVERKTKKGASRGKNTKRRRIEPFVDSQVSSIIKFTSDEYGNEINKFIEKKAKRLNK